MFTTILVYFPSALLAIYFFYNRFFHPLAKVPGPFLASLTPFWIAYQGFHQRRPRLDLELHKKYGSIVRISPNEIIFSNPQYFKPVYGAGTKFTKGSFYEAPTDKSQEPGWEKLDMLTELDVEKLRVQKRFAGPIYSISNGKKHEACIDENLRRFLGRMKMLTTSHHGLPPKGMYYEFEILIVDIMTEMTFGSCYGAVEKGSDEGHMAGMDKMWEWWGWIGYLPWVNWVDKAIAPWKMVFTASAVHLPVFPYVVGKLMEYDQTVAEGKAGRPGLLDDMRKLSKERPEFIQNWGTRLAMTDLGAGVDTMSWTLATMIGGVGMNPKVQQRLYAETETALKQGLLVKGKPVSYDEAIKLPYLQACLQESLRLWPNIAVSLPRIAPEEGIEIDGYYIPGGFTVGMNSKQLGLNENIFGSDPHLFRPERWLEASKSQRNDMESRNLAFGGPSRKCPGMHVALLCVSKVLATLFVNFRVELLNSLDGPKGPGGEKWVEKGSFPTKWHGMEVRIIAK